MKPILIGGLGEVNYGKQYRQGNRVYSSESVAMAITAQPLGNTGGYSYLYLIEVNNKNKLLKQYVALDEQNSCLRFDTFGCLTTDGSSPKHNNRVVEFYGSHSNSTDG